MKEQSVFYAAARREAARRNIAEHLWAADTAQQILEAAQPWMRLSDDDLWGLMFAATIPRSHQVWSDGHCPACRESVPMTFWKTPFPRIASLSCGGPSSEIT